MKLSRTAKWAAVGAGCLCLPVLWVLAEAPWNPRFKPIKPTHAFQGPAAPASQLPEPLTFNFHNISLQEHEVPEIKALAFSPDGKTVTACSPSRNGTQPATFRLWDLKTGKDRASKQDKCHIHSVAYAHSGAIIATGGFDDTVKPGGTVKLRDPVSGQVRRVFKGHEFAVSCVAFSTDDKILASGTFDSTIKLWDVATGMELATLGQAQQVIHHMIHAMAIAPDGETLAAASWDGTVKLWDLKTRKMRLTLLKDGASSMTFSPDGQTLATGGRSGVKLWDPTTGTEKATLAASGNGVTSVAFSPDGNRLAGGCWDHEIRIWDMTTLQQQFILKGQQKSVKFVAFSPDGKLLGSGGDDGIIEVWDPATGKEAATLVAPGAIQLVMGMAYSPDGHCIAMAREDRTVVVQEATGMQLPRNRVVAILQGHEDIVAGVAFSPDGKTLASASHDRTIRLWDTGTWKERSVLKGHRNLVYCVAFSPDGKRLASGSYDKTIKLWDPAAGIEQETLRGHKAAVRSIAFAPDGKTLASGSSDRTIRLWDTATFKEVAQFKGHQGAVRGVAFSADGQLLASGSEDRTTKLWAVQTGKERTTFKQADEVWTVAFSASGKTLASAGTVIHIYDPLAGKPFGTVGRNTGPITSIAFSPGGTWMCSASHDKTVLRWEAMVPLVAPPRDKILAAMEKQVPAMHAYKLVQKGPNEKIETPLVLHPRSLLSPYEDKEQHVLTAVFYHFGNEGRPLALLWMEYLFNANSAGLWRRNLVSLSSEPLVVRGPEGWKWSPPGREIAWNTLANAPAPAVTPAERTGQMIKLAERFTATAPSQGVLALKRIPQAIHRYSEPSSEIADGGMFAFVNKDQPRMILLIEARGKGTGRLSWQYGLVGLSQADLQVALDKQVVETLPPLMFGSEKTYGMFNSGAYIDSQPPRPPGPPGKVLTNIKN